MKMPWTPQDNEISKSGLVVSSFLCHSYKWKGVLHQGLSLEWWAWEERVVIFLKLTIWCNVLEGKRPLRWYRRNKHDISVCFIVLSPFPYSSGHEKFVLLQVHKNCMPQVVQCHGYHGKPGTQSALCLFLWHLCAPKSLHSLQVLQLAWKHLMPSAQKSVRFVEHLWKLTCWQLVVLNSSHGMAQRLDIQQRLLCSAIFE